jgi:hypothetical protein
MLKFENKADYWSQFTSKESEFENEVRKGILFRTDRKTELPDPPEGYNWALDCGGTIFRNKLTYRLWAVKLGHMPGSE